MQELSWGRSVTAVWWASQRKKCFSIEFTLYFWRCSCFLDTPMIVNLLG